MSGPLSRLRRLITAVRRGDCLKCGERGASMLHAYQPRRCAGRAGP
jgi:hypothetical protein